MAGGEFCGNACCCAAKYMYDKNKTIKCTIEICGIKVNSLCDENNVKIAIKKNALIKSIQRENTSISIIFMEGITHIVVKDSQGSFTQAKQLFEKYKNYLNKCIGFIFAKQESSNRISINPFIYVKDCNTFINEKACASGSLATAYCYNIDDVSIIQPSGAEFRICQDDNNLFLTEKVDLLYECN